MDTVTEIKAARALLGWSQGDLAKVSGVSLPSVKRIEASGDLSVLREGTRTAIRDAFTRAGIQFVLAGDIAEGQGVVLRQGEN